jgi:tryptophan-rich sensory protein
MTRQYVGLLVSLAVCLGVAQLGSLLTRPEIPTWYAGLNKPAWNPPNWVFPVVWTTLYVLMAVAAWLVWKSGGIGHARVALSLFGIQLALNLVWSAVFFRMHQPGWAVVEILILWVLILTTVIAFWQVRQAAAWLMLPYLAWVAFAACLNFAIWRLNS